MKIKSILFIILLSSVGFLKAQNNVFSPYSRYGIGELAQSTFAHNNGMGGACVALKPDSTMPIFINVGNPASYAYIRLTSLEVGGRFIYSDLRSTTTTLKKWGTNFGYGALGFPIKGNGGACFGLMPYSYVGYDTENTANTSGIGDVNYKYSGTGGINKAFIGYGVMPFKMRLVKFRKKNLTVPDSLKRLGNAAYRIIEFGSKLLSDFSIGANANYLFGNIQNTSRIEYPSSLLYNNTYSQKEIFFGDFTGNFGVQTALTVDSIRIGMNKRRALKEKLKFTFGYFMNINNSMKANYNSVVLNTIKTGSGQEIIRDTAYYKVNQSGKITLPVEQSFGIGLKKSEKLNLVADFGITAWKNFKYIETLNELKDNYRFAIGANYVPEKYAAGRRALWKRVNYRLGFNYESGYIQVKNVVLNSYFVSAGLGLPVGIGRLSSMVNLSVQYGQMGTTKSNLLKENYFRVNFGFTFSDRWFQKFRYD